MMGPVRSVNEALEGIQRAKAEAGEFVTNFFPAPAKVQAWIEHGDLLWEHREGVTFFVRKDRDFWRLYFCAPSPGALQAEAAALGWLTEHPVMTDLVGAEPLPAIVAGALEAAGFRPYVRLQRMARLGVAQADDEAAAPRPQVEAAGASDCEEILGLLESQFDRYGEQLPLAYELEPAVQGGEILAAKRQGRIAGLLFFETRGLASAIRFWVVREKFRGLRIGSALMSHYFGIQRSVRRFTLWVQAANEEAIAKYQHFGYAADGLFDQVLANGRVPA